MIKHLTNRDLDELIHRGIDIYGRDLNFKLVNLYAYLDNNLVRFIPEYLFLDSLRADES